jgi:2-hydroxycyclohexanecarboxyl-CoA dehydrogenase
MEWRDVVDLTKKLTVVTGGASGIGRATVLKMAAAGAVVFSGDMDEAGNAETADMANRSGGNVIAITLDIADRDSVAAFAAASTNGGMVAVDIIVNVAGWDRIQPFLDATPEFMDKVLDINLKGPMNVVKAFLPAMVEANAGKIISISSDAGRVGSMGETIYAGAKGGVIAFTKSLARETARHKINVNCVCPGPTNTPLLMAQPESMREKLARAVPFRRIGEPEEIADAVLFFASDMSNYITGQILSVSGGLTMAD